VEKSTERNAMFNRSLEMKVVKTPKNGETSSPEKNQIDTIAAMQAVTTTVIREGGKVVITYVIFDTIRKIILTGITRS
jgi:hypothetical protein